MYPMREKGKLLRIGGIFLKKHLTQIRQSAESSSRIKTMTSYLSSSNKNEFISSLGTAVRKHILRDIKVNKYFGILFDSTPNVSHVSGNCIALYFEIFFGIMISCGRTKCISICESVLVPIAQEILLNDIKEAEFFPVATVASNKGNVKMFPIVVHYFHKESGINHRLLDFYRNSQEKSGEIKEQICPVFIETLH